MNARSPAPLWRDALALLRLYFFDSPAVSGTSVAGAGIVVIGLLMYATNAIVYALPFDGSAVIAAGLVLILAPPIIFGGLLLRLRLANRMLMLLPRFRAAMLSATLLLTILPVVVTLATYALMAASLPPPTEFESARALNLTIWMFFSASAFLWLGFWLSGRRYGLQATWLLWGAFILSGLQNHPLIEVLRSQLSPGLLLVLSAALWALGANALLRRPYFARIAVAAMALTRTQHTQPALWSRQRLPGYGDPGAALLTGMGTGWTSRMLYALGVTYLFPLIIILAFGLKDESFFNELLSKPTQLILFMMFPLILPAAVAHLQLKRARSLWLRLAGSRIELLRQIEKHYWKDFALSLVHTALLLILITALTPLAPSIALPLIPLWLVAQTALFYVVWWGVFTQRAAWLWACAFVAVFILIACIALLMFKGATVSWPGLLLMLSGLAIYLRSSVAKKAYALDFSQIHP